MPLFKSVISQTLVKVHTFKLKHEDNEEKETFDVEKSDGITIKMLFNTVLSFQTMSTRMAFTSAIRP